MTDNFPTFRRIGDALNRMRIWLFPRLWRFTKKAAKVTAVVLIVFVIVHTTLWIIWSRQTNAQIDQIRQKGEPVCCADLVPKPIPDAENAAVIYEKAFKSLNALDALKNSRTPAFIQLVTDQSYSDPDHDPRVTEATARKELAQQAETLNLIITAVAKPKCQFNIQWKDGFSTEYPHLRQLQSLCRMVQAKAVIEAKDGKTDTALNDILIAFKVADSIRNEPSLISFLVRIAMMRDGLRTLQTVSNYRPLTGIQCQRIYRALSNDGLNKNHKIVMLGERAQNIQLFGWIRRNPVQCVVMTRDFSDGSTGSATLDEKALYWTLDYLYIPLCHKDEQAYIRYTSSLIQATQLPYKEFTRKYPDSEAGQVTKYAFLTHMLSPVYGRMWASRDGAKAEIGLAQTAMAIKAYKVQSGEYPASLTELRQKLGWNIPEDPFTGKDFVYSKKGNGFMLYSYGYDLENNHGLTRKEAGVSKNYDIVWKSDR